MSNKPIKISHDEDMVGAYCRNHISIRIGMPGYNDISLFQTILDCYGGFPGHAFWPFWIILDQYGPVLDHFGPVWTNYSHFIPFQALLDHFGLF